MLPGSGRKAFIDTAPHAVLRTLWALPRAPRVPSLRAAWTTSAAVTALYAPQAPVAYAPPGTFTSEEVFERALAHGDEHVIKLTDTALDVGDERALAAALRSVELSEPLVQPVASRRASAFSGCV